MKHTIDGGFTMRRLSRIRHLIESEIRKSLEFQLSPETDLDGIASGDRVRFRVFVRNGSDLTIRRVSGFVAPTHLTSFAMRQFDLENLEPGQDVEVAQIDARVATPARTGTDWLAKLTVVANTFLGVVQMRDAGRYLAPRSTPGTRPRAATPVRSIPLSDAPGPF